MKKILLATIIIFVATTMVGYSQFKYLGDSTWQTNTATVMKVRQSYNDLNYYKAKSDSLADVVKGLQQITDSSKKQIARLQHTDTLHQERESQLESVIREFEKPVVITVPNKWIEYEGTYAWFMAYNTFPDNIGLMSAFRPQAKITSSIKLFDRVRIGGELLYKPTPLEGQKPWEINVGVGIKAF